MHRRGRGLLQFPGRAGVALAIALAVSLLSTRASAQAPQTITGNCTDAGCHDEFARRKIVHEPARPGGCDGCHEQTAEGRHAFKFAEEGGALCEQCHDAFEGTTVHPPVAQGQCTTCHDPHGGTIKNLLKADSIAELCAECHDDFKESFEFVHGPVAVGACTACHAPHASDHAALLSADGPALCKTCHEAIGNRIDKATYRHQPATEDCVSCHDPHGADNRLNLKETPPVLCTDCHDEIGETIEDAPVQHDAIRSEESCLRCHDPHAARFDHMLAKAPMDLCLECHDREVESDGRKLTAIGALLRANPDHHGPIRQRNCTACHQEIHGGEHTRLLKGSYPPEFYAPFDEARYAFCFGCHEADLVRDAKTDKLTNFRNGDRNLHYLHVHRSVKGRTCRACHETHASRRPKHLAESVPFGKWRIPINYQAAETGGSCQPGCHKRYRYDRVKPVQNLPPPPAPDIGQANRNKPDSGAESGGTGG